VSNGDLKSTSERTVTELGLAVIAAEAEAVAANARADAMRAALDQSLTFIEGVSEQQRAWVTGIRNIVTLRVPGMGETGVTSMSSSKS